MKALLSVLIAIFALSACYTPPVYRETIQPQEQADSSLWIQYLGSGGLLIQYQNKQILTAPFFSNCPIPRVPFFSIKPDTALIDSVMPYLPNVHAILVGHSHYDHLLDVPYIAQNQVPAAHIYGSNTMRNILLHKLPSERLHSVVDSAGTEKYVGKWYEVFDDSGTFHNIRFMAIESEHAPHFGGPSVNMTLFEGVYDTKPEHFPKRATHWRVGKVFAYIIEFLNEDSSLAYRIYYQDAPSNPPLGHPPMHTFDPQTVDVAILCVPTWDKVVGHPQSIVTQVQPNYVVLSHWEDFFSDWSSDPDKLEPVPLTNQDGFLRKFNEVFPDSSRWFLPYPTAWIRIPPGGE